MAFPWFEGEGVKSLVRVKLETVAEPLHRQTALQPKEGVYGLFGWNTIPNEAKEVTVLYFLSSISTHFQTALTNLLICFLNKTLDQTVLLWWGSSCPA